MQEGIKIKSKDINFVISTFYLAINLYSYIFVIIHIKIISSRLVYLPTFKN